MYEDSPPGVIEPGKRHRRDKSPAPHRQPEREAMTESASDAVSNGGFFDTVRTRRYDSWNASHEWQRPGLSKTWMNVTALFASFFGIVIAPLALAGVVFGHLGLRAVRRGQASLRPLGVVALWIGYIASFFWLALFGFALASAAGWVQLDY